eukprot:2397711-Amphidinium_carterae.1
MCHSSYSELSWRWDWTSPAIVQEMSQVRVPARPCSVQVGGENKCKKVGGENEREKVGRENEREKVGGENEREKVGGENERKKVF